MSNMATLSPVCGICDLRHISKPSVVWCPECDEGLCEDCKEHHTLSKSSRNHSVIAASAYQKLPFDILKTTLICSEHNEQYQMYCKKHASPCCRRCISENHNSCIEICPLEDVIHNVKTSSAFQEIEQTLKEVAENYERIMQNRKENLKSLKNLKDKIQIEILQVRLKINSHLDIIQDNLIKKLNETEERECKKIRNLLKPLEKKEQEVKKIQSDIANIKQYASDFQSFLAMKHIDIIATESFKSIQELLSSDNLEETYLSLNLDTGLEKFSVNFQTFGDICADYKPTAINIVQRKNVQAQLVSSKLYTGSIDNINLNLNQTIMVSRGNTGCIYLADGRYAIASSESGLSIVNKDGSTEFQIKLNGNLFDATHYPLDNTIAVSSGFENQCHINFVCLEKRKVMKKLSLDFPVGGIVYRDGYFILCAGNKGIQMMNIRDKSVTNLVSSSMSRNAYITSFGNYIYYTDLDKSSVTCCDLRGKPRWTFKEEGVLPVPLGITVDNEGNVYVVDNRLSKVVVISPDGQKYRQLLSEDDGITLPWCITYERTTDRLLVVNWKTNAYIYTVTK
ncbi:uncharacterized protein LOC127704718 isoform X2 [Mytilus californianus]|uniref:uncharacterized protein LOC127704718 isoform X2 n=1 Tax=Mytilus californianus TaxID=6549 RepID=UPI00224654BE|nr:uncharacterized protein LOC127704718 isoform X2 [Mytilus californianus]